MEWAQYFHVLSPTHGTMIPAIMVRLLQLRVDKMGSVPTCYEKVTLDYMDLYPNDIFPYSHSRKRCTIIADEGTVFLPGDHHASSETLAVFDSL